LYTIPEKTRDDYIGGTKTRCAGRCHRARLILGLCLFIASLAIHIPLSTTPAGAAGKQASEYEVKAACLYNFVRFVDWPAAGTSPPDSLMIIGILGEDPFGDAFAPVEGKLVKAKSRRLLVRRFGRYKHGLNLEACHVLFISSSEQADTREILKDVESVPVLTVGEIDGFLELGGIINLVTVNEKIRWEIDRGHAALAGLELSSQLLRTAVRVIETRGEASKSKTR
jgi:hypothetical protein